MTNPIQLLRDFRKWRKERYKRAYDCVLAEIANDNYSQKTQPKKNCAYWEGLKHGIEHRKEILKQVKI